MLNSTDQRRLELERELYAILSELWNSAVPGVFGDYVIIINSKMAKRIRAALGQAED